MPSIIQKAPTHRHYAEIFRIAIPLGLANLLLAGNSTVDLLMIGQLGTSEIAGATLSIQLYLLLVVFGGGVLMAFTPLFSIARTQKAANTAGATFVGALLLAVIISAFAAVVMWLSPTILDAFGVEQKLTELAQSYGRVAAFSILPSLILVILWEMANVQGKSIWVTASSLVGFFTNGLLNWLFIQAGWNLPGVAFATLISNCVVILCILLAVFPEIGELLPYMRNIKAGVAALPGLLRLGLPIGSIELATVGFFASSTYLMSVESSEVIAAHAIAYQITELAIIFFLGFGEAATILVASAFGERDWLKLKQIAISITFSCMAMSAVVSFTMAILSSRLPSLFLTGDKGNNATHTMATTFILIGCSFTMLDALQIAWLGILRGMQDPIRPMVLVMIGYWLIGVPACYALAHPLGFGPVGIWWGLAIGLAFTCLGLGWRMLQHSKLPLRADKKVDLMES